MRLESFALDVELWERSKGGLRRWGALVSDLGTGRRSRPEPGAASGGAAGEAQINSGPETPRHQEWGLAERRPFLIISLRLRIKRSMTSSDVGVSHFIIMLPEEKESFPPPRDQRQVR